MFRKILVCLDGSEFAEQILPYAYEQAVRFGGKMVLLRVIEPNPIYASTPVGQPVFIPPKLVEERMRRDESQAAAYLERMTQRLREKGLDVDCVALLGMPGETIGNLIVSYAATNEVDLIAMATHGYTGLKRLILGSTVEFVVKKSAVPVMVIRPQDAIRQRSPSSKGREAVSALSQWKGDRSEEFLPVRGAKL